MKRTAILLGALLLLFAAMTLKGELLRLPNVPQHAAPGAFDTGRAMARLQRILGDQRPHPVDSAEGDAARNRLVAEIGSLGLKPTITDSFTCSGSPRDRAVYCARVHNVRTTIGPATGKQVLLVSHYDSTPVGPGAADDGIGVATMLETAALLKDRPLKRPVSFLFDEGEEAGLNGARGFLDHDPLAAQVDSAINFESRGVTGPAIMFETSRPNGAALDAFSRATWHPMANSLTTDFYRLIPNDTDVSVLKARPWTILNFAIIGNETRYHSAGDTLAVLDPRSLRHMGEQAVAAATQLANGRQASDTGKRVYADLLGRALLTIPATLGFALLGGIILLFAMLGWRRRNDLGRSAATIAGAIVGSGLLAWLAESLLGLARPGVFFRGHPGVISLAIDITAIAVPLAVLVRRGGSAGQDRLAFWLLFLLIGLLLCLPAPGAVIFFLLPPLAAGLAMLPGSTARLGRAGAIVAALLLFLSWAPLLHLSEVLLDFGNGWIFAGVGALIVLPILIELKPLAEGLSARPLVLGCAAIVALAWAATLLPSAYSPDRKQAFGIEYVRDATTGKSQWMVVNDGAPLPSGFDGFEHGRKVPWSSRRRWAADAPPSPQPAPRVDKLAERPVSGGRLVRLRLSSAGYYSILLHGEPDAGFRAVAAGGTVAPFGKGKANEPYLLRCQGRSCDGVLLDLLLPAGKPVPITLIGLRNGLPSFAAPLLRARPANAQPQYMPDQMVSVSKLAL